MNKRMLLMIAADSPLSKHIAQGLAPKFIVHRCEFVLRDCRHTAAVIKPEFVLADLALFPEEHRTELCDLLCGKLHIPMLDTSNMRDPYIRKTDRRALMLEPPFSYSGLPDVIATVIENELQNQQELYNELRQEIDGKLPQFLSDRRLVIGRECIKESLTEVIINGADDDPYMSAVFRTAGERLGLSGQAVRKHIRRVFTEVWCISDKEQRKVLFPRSSGDLPKRLPYSHILHYLAEQMKKCLCCTSRSSCGKDSRASESCIWNGCLK